MLGAKAAVATAAVRDLKAARSFYEGILGLKPVHTEGEEAVEYETGSSHLLVYRSQYAGGNQATAVTWMVGKDAEGLARELAAKGVVFEKYDLPGMTRQGDIYSAGGMKVAWFKDPDGNIHSLVGE